MPKEWTALECSECRSELLRYRRRNQGQISYKYPPWGAFAVAVDAEALIYDVVCANCKHAERFQPGRHYFKRKASPVIFERARITNLSNPLYVDDKAIMRAKYLAKVYENYPLFRECIAAFSANFDRVAAIGLVTVLVSGFARQLRSIEERQKQHIRAERKKSGSLDLASDSGRRLVALQHEKRLLFASPVPQHVNQIVQQAGRREMCIWSQIHPEIRSGITTTLSAQLTLAWTAFEILASDLWVAAVNWDSDLAVRYSDAGGNSQSKSISIPSLASYGTHDFNLSNLMGDVLRDTKADFTSLKSTKFVYESTFGTKFHVFDSGELKLLELLRNLISHKSGIADERFIKGISDSFIKSAITDLPAIEAGEAFPITSKLAKQLINGAIVEGENLVEAVRASFSPDHEAPTKPE